MQKLFKRIISTLTAIVVICACVLPVQAKIDGNGALVYKSDNSSTFDPGGATYSRIICLKNSGSSNGTLLCTFDQLKKVTVMVTKFQNKFIQFIKAQTVETVGN